MFVEVRGGHTWMLPVGTTPNVNNLDAEFPGLALADVDGRRSCVAGSGPMPAASYVARGARSGGRPLGAREAARLGAGEPADQRELGGKGTLASACVHRYRRGRLKTRTRDTMG